LQGNLRIPVLIGVGSETLQLTDYELVRGSSSTTDNVKTNEDASLQFDGSIRVFNTSIFPVVTGEGQGVPTYDPKDVGVTVNGQPVGIAQIDGPTGTITLSVIPREDDEVLVSYFFKRTDTRIGGSTEFPDKDDLSTQVNGTNTEFKVDYVPIVDGTNGGLATTDPSKVEVIIIRGTSEFIAEVAEVNGQAGVITLADAPLIGDTVLASYWTNRWQDTFDYLPVSNITDVVRVGTGPGRSDFTNTLDFVIQENRIHWGHAFDISSGFTSPTTGSVPFKDQINATLFDNRLYSRPIEGISDGLNTEFLLEFVPTEGTGKGKATDNPDLIKAYVGATLSAAMTAGAVELTKVSGAARRIYLKDAPLVGEKVFATYWYNILTDDTYTFSSTLVSTTSTEGEYEVFSENKGGVNVQNMVEDMPSHSVSDPNFGTEGITYPMEGFDGVLIPGFSKEETVLLNFFNATDFLVLSSIGAEGTNGSGTLGQTYIDEKTGTRFTVMPGTTVTYQAGDILEYDIGSTFKTGGLQHLSIPGMRTQVNDLNNVTAGNTALYNTFNKSGLEPRVGDFYFITANYAKVDFPISIYTRIRDIVTDFGDVNTDNRISLGASLAFSNGAIAIAMAQVLRDDSGVDASPGAYFEVLRTLESPVEGTNVRPDIICALTTNTDVTNEVR
ncbi:hypothetical protein N9948_02245, partial [bacterium]|nr:hypothetical protein [bacterium]